MSNWIGLPEDTTGYIGFVYLIRNNHPDVVDDITQPRYYYGQKKLLRRVKRKPLKGKTRNRISHVDNGVQDYWGSSNQLLKDIEKYGIEHFSREVLEMCTSKFQMTYAELDYQIKSNALFDKRFYNQIINVRLSKIPKGYVDIIRDPSTLGL